MNLTWQQSIGIQQQHLIDAATVTSQNNRSVSKHSLLIHQAISHDLQRLFSAAEKDGVAIHIVSSFRSFDRQLAIWNDKWQGYRPVYSRHGRPLNILALSDMEKYKAISLWSALPGLSRHHWGTDLDIFLAQPIGNGYQVKLTPQEFDQDGVCESLNQWLSENLERYGFFRPYQNYQNGISEEPWHISHFETSNALLAEFPYNECLQQLNRSEIKSKDFITNVFDHYKQQYFTNICSPISLE